MTDSIRIRALEKLAWNPLTGLLPKPNQPAQPAKPQEPVDPPGWRKRVGDALVYGGNALSAQGQADSSYRSWKARKMISEAPKLTPGQVKAFIPKGVGVATDEATQRGILSQETSPYADLFSQWAADRQIDNAVSQVQTGENAFYVPRHWHDKDGRLVLPPNGVSESVLGHELGHRDADLSRTGYTDRYRDEIDSARTEDLAILPQDMFTAPSTNAFGVVTTPGLEREAWDRVPVGMKVDPKIREAALDSYTAARKANAKNFYGNLGIMAGKLIRPKKRK